MLMIIVTTKPLLMVQQLCQCGLAVSPRITIGHRNHEAKAPSLKVFCVLWPSSASNTFSGLSASPITSLDTQLHHAVGDENAIKCRRVAD
jgi:hypothetical protein